MDLKEIRNQIDEIDSQILALFTERMKKCADVAAYKKSRSMPILNSGREQEILRKVNEQAGDMGVYAVRLFEKMMSLSREYQSKLNDVCGLLGRKLGHSRSPEIHALLGTPSYRLFEKEPEELEAFLKSDTIGLLNVTIPYKRDVMRYCDELEETAAQIGSVNTLYVKNGKLTGANTDIDGFFYMAKRAKTCFKGKKVVIFGSGGASLTAQYAAKKEGAAQVVVVSRTGEDNYDNLSRHYDADILINTTPLGMFPDCGSCPADPSLFPNCESVLDLVYNPCRTVFLMKAQEKGIPCSGGLSMLVSQAAKAEERFTGMSFDDEIIGTVTNKLSRDMQNIVLIGMPGSGKSTVGEKLAEMTGRELIDIDSEIVKSAGRSIPDIFAESGEKVFRDMEKEQIRLAGARQGAIIVTGGGAVLDRDNLPPLRCNGRIYFIRRDLSLLPRDGRPLSQTADLAKMYEQRLPKYLDFCDVPVDNDGTVDDCAGRIWEEFDENTRY